jgi:hypothetical protein
MAEPSVVLRRAAFSRCGAYRYALWRTWDETRPAVLFVALNPSTADHRRDDPTIRRCIGFARSWGYGGLLVANLFAYRTPHPRILRAAPDPVGPRNDRWISRLAREAAFVVAAWGADGDFRGRADEVLHRVRDCQCLGLTSAGAPRHPLYVRKDVLHQPFGPRAGILTPTVP